MNYESRIGKCFYTLPCSPAYLMTSKECRFVCLTLVFSCLQVLAKGWTPRGNDQQVGIVIRVCYGNEIMCFYVVVLSNLLAWLWSIWKLVVIGVGESSYCSDSFVVLTTSWLISSRPCCMGRGNLMHSCRWKTKVAKSASAACFRCTDKTCWGQAGWPAEG